MFTVYSPCRIQRFLSSRNLCKYPKMFFATLGLGLFCYSLFYALVTGLVDCDLELAFYERFGKSIRRLKGKVVFITGASSGIGEHTAIALARYGVRLVLTARRRDELERVKASCIANSQGQLTADEILVLPMDMLDMSAHKKNFDHAVRHFGQVDILFNNAGRSQRAMWEDIEMTVDRQMFDLNVFSVVNLTRIAVRYFKERGYGHVAVTSSLAGVMGVPISGTYTATKHAIHGYFNSLRNEKSGKGLAVSLLCPGPTFTNFLQESFTERDGQKYGVTVQPTDKRMSGERCGHLCAVALANKTKESWMAVFPLVPFTYVAVYFPTVFSIVLKMVGPEKLFKYRDSTEVNLTKEN